MPTKKPANPQLTQRASLPSKGPTMPRKPAAPPLSQQDNDVLDKVTTKKPGTALVSYKDRMAALVATTKKAEAPQGGFLSTKNGRLSMGETALPNDTIRAIIIDYRKDNEFYPKAYETGVSAYPTCHAVVRPHEIQTPWRLPREGEDVSKLVKADGMVADCEKPQVKAGLTCSSCQMLEWGSAKFIEGKTGGLKGKACRESRRLHLFAADQCTTPGDVDRAPHMTLIPPPTSLGNFQTFANEVTTVLDTPIFGVIVDISVKPHPQYQFMVHYKLIEQITDEGILLALLNRHEQIAAKTMQLPKGDDPDAKKDQRGGKF